MLHISQCVSSRQTVWHLPHVSISFLSKVMYRKRTLLWHIVTSSGQNTFLPITIDRKEIETWIRSQFVCLDKTHGLICNMTYLGHFRDLTWGQISKLTFRGHVMIKIGHVAYVSMRLDGTDSVIPFPSLKIHFLKVTLQTTCNFPMTSSCDLGALLRGHWHQMTKSKPGLLLRTTQTTDCHQPHLDISTQSGDMNRKRSQRHLYMALCS